MAKVITFNTNSNNQFTIITIFKTKFLSNITITLIPQHYYKIFFLST